MIRGLKFRVFKDGVFHYWGFIDDSDGMVFASPPLSGQISDIQKISEQFTGLLDCNKTPIYEGDVLSFVPMNHPKYENPFKPFEVFWDEKAAGFSPWAPRDRAEVIGNIHENPELLET